MKITIVNQFYLPDSVPTAQLAGSLAENLADRGHDVTVVCGRGAYGGGVIGGGIPNGVRVVRLWTPSLGKRRLAARAADYAAFYCQVVTYLGTMRRQDVVLAMTTPPFIALGTLIHKLIHRTTKIVLWNMDTYPDVAEMTGHIRRGSTLSSALRFANRILFRRLDLVIALDQSMAKSLSTSYFSRDKCPAIIVVPNWERAKMFPPETPSRTRGHTASDKFILLYLGNMGHAHEFGSIMLAAERMRHDPVVFLFVGGGAEWGTIEKLKNERGLANVELRGYVPKNETATLMAGCDAALITLRPEAKGLVSPSKLHSYLALSLPVIYVGPPETNVDEAIVHHRVGYSLRQGDIDGIVNSIRDIRTNRIAREELQLRARAAFDNHYNDNRAVSEINAALKSLITPTR